MRCSPRAMVVTFWFGFPGLRALKVGSHDAAGEHMLAIIDFSEALKRDPALVQAYFDRAMAYEAVRERERSMADLSKAMRLDPNMVGALHMQRGYELRTARQYDEAVSALIAQSMPTPIGHWLISAAVHHLKTK
jgi:tetratricopeptide (TPR) repeat protein